METRSTELQSGYYDPLRREDFAGKENLLDETAKGVLEDFLRGLPEGAKVLDAGTGVGVEATIIEQSGKDVYPLDLSVKMLERAREYGLATGETGHLERLTQADIFKLPYADSTFEAVVSKDVLSLGGLDERQQIIVELKRVLKPNGKLLIMVEEIPETVAIINGIEKRGTIPELTVQLSDGDVVNEIKQVEIHEKYLAGILRDEGFEDIKGSTQHKDMSRWISDNLVVVEGTKVI